MLNWSSFPCDLNSGDVHVLRYTVRTLCSDDMALAWNDETNTLQVPTVTDVESPTKHDLHTSEERYCLEEKLSPLTPSACDTDTGDETLLAVGEDQAVPNNPTLTEALQDMPDISPPDLADESQGKGTVMDILLHTLLVYYLCTVTCI